MSYFKAMMNHTDLYIHINVYSQQCYVSFCLVFVWSHKHDKTHTLYDKIYNDILIEICIETRVKSLTCESS